MIFSMLRPVTATFRPQAAAASMHLLDAVHVAGKGGDDDALVAAGELAGEGLAHRLLAHGVAGALHVGGVRQQRQYALLAQLRRTGPDR